MLFSSITFLYYFLPIVLLLYVLVPKPAKNFVLLLSSLLFYFWGEPLYSLIMVASALIGWLFGLLIGKTRGGKWGKLVLWASVICCLAPLLFFKYSDFFLSNINALFRSDLALLGLALPIGISFYTFQIMSYTIDVYRGEARVQKNPISFMAYVTLFPQLIAGPIVRYQTVQDELDDRRMTLADFSSGITRFCIGLGKKVILANSLAELGNLLAAVKERSVLNFWLWAIAFALQIYFDFSGYSDMAIGLGRMFGFHFIENFNYPFISRSITEFWRRWHISLGSWFRDYVYIPLGGSRCSFGRWFRNVLVVWFLTGFWHGASWNFIAWGLYFAFFLLIEKLFLSRLLDKLPGALRSVYVLVFIVFSFVLFNANTLPEAWGNLAGMFGAGDRMLADPQTLYYLSANVLLIAISAIGSTPLPKLAVEKIAASKIGGVVMNVLEVVFCLGILVIVTGYLVDGSFNPFLYFRF